MSWVRQVLLYFFFSYLVCYLVRSVLLCFRYLVRWCFMYLVMFVFSSFFITLVRAVVGSFFMQWFR